MNFLRQLFLNNLGLKGISLSLAFLMWLQIPKPEIVTTTRSVRVELINQPVELQITNNYAQRVDVEIRSEGGAIEEQTLTALIDLTRASPGSHVFPLTARNIKNIPRRASILSIQPSTIRLELERIAGKIVRIEAETTGEPKENYEVTHKKVFPPGVMVRGPESRLQDLSMVQTEPIDIEGRSDSLSQSVSVYLEEPRLHIQNPTPVTVEITIEEKRREIRLRRVSVQALPSGARARLTPSRVDVLGSVPISFEGKLRPADFLALVSLKGIQANSGPQEIAPRIRIPPEYANIFRTDKITPSQITVRVK